LHISFSQRIICRRNEFVAKKRKKEGQGRGKRSEGSKGREEKRDIKNECEMGGEGERG
jgi:hypothetical protein